MGVFCGGHRRWRIYDRIYASINAAAAPHGCTIPLKFFLQPTHIVPNLRPSFQNAVMRRRRRHSRVHRAHKEDAHRTHKELFKEFLCGFITRTPYVFLQFENVQNK